MAANNCMQCDVAIDGSGFAGALIANELSQKGIKVVVLEAGSGVPPNINDYMKQFYKAAAKVPESPFPPKLKLKDTDDKLRVPAKVAAGRPTVLSLAAVNWKDPEQSYLVQTGPSPFTSTYERVAGGTSHWLGTSLRFVPNDFKMKTLYGKSVPEFVDWPIGYDDLVDWYGKAEAELGVSANVDEQAYLGINFP